MNTRVRLIGWIALMGGLGLAGLWLLRAAVMRPVKTLDSQIAQLQQRWRSLQSEQQAYYPAETQLKDFARRTFAAEVDRANALAGALLTDTILRVGLNEREFTRVPLGPTRLPGAREVGWSIQGEGPLAKIIDLLFLLDQVPLLHRCQNLVLTPTETLGRVRVRFRFLTVVLDPAPGPSATNVTLTAQLESPERRLYDPIVQRDLLRPYIRRVPPPTEAAPAAPTPSPEHTATNPALYRVVSLSAWNGQPEVHVRHADQPQTLVFKPGDDLLDGRIVTIDYRPWPKPGVADLLSFSRVILRVGDQFWAVERGQTLAERYPLNPEQLPPDLHPPPLSSP